MKLGRLACNARLHGCLTLRRSKPEQERQRVDDTGLEADHGNFARRHASVRPAIMECIDHVNLAAIYLGW